MRLLSRDRLHTNNPLLESMNDPRSGSKAWEALDRERVPPMTWIVFHPGSRAPKRLTMVCRPIAVCLAFPFMASEAKLRRSIATADESVSFDDGGLGGGLL
jgi:hypothetical protein